MKKIFIFLLPLFASCGGSGSGSSQQYYNEVCAQFKQ